jgi:hypothetical protein
MLPFALASQLDDPLLGVKAKLARANEHMKTLDKQWGTFGETETYTCESKEGPEPNHWNCYFIERPVPIEFSVILGDVLHNLRSTLDHLVGYFVERHGGTVERHHAFPIHDCETTYEGLVNQRRRKRDGAGPLDGIPAGSPERALIQESQPYHRGDEARSHPLAVLNNMVNIDKHRAIHVVAAYPQATDALDLLAWPADAELIDHTSIWQPGEPLKGRTHIASLRFSDAHPADEVGMKANLPLAIAFGEGPPQDVRLEDIFAYVSQIISSGTEVILL